MCVSDVSMFFPNFKSIKKGEGLRPFPLLTSILLRRVRKLRQR